MVPWGMNKSSFLSITEVHASDSWGGVVSMQDAPWSGQPPKKGEESFYKYCCPEELSRWRNLGDYSSQDWWWMPWRRDGERIGEREREERRAQGQDTDPVPPTPTTLPTICTCASLKNVVGEIEYGLYIFVSISNVLGMIMVWRRMSLFLGAHAKVFKDEVSCICNFQRERETERNGTEVSCQQPGPVCQMCEWPSREVTLRALPILPPRDWASADI